MVGPFNAKSADVVLSCVVKGEPCAKERSRWNKKTQTSYTPEKTRHRELGISLIARAGHRELVMDPMGLFSLRAAFYLGTNQARDVDNMLKLVSDALKGIVWEDDRQVAEVFGFKTPADRPEEARTEIAVIRLPGAMPYTFGNCIMCHRAYRTYPSWKYRQCCSRLCWGLSIRRRDA
jgi:Holliday junction resolvase RusA-like endonuclease